jgi:hypothetical protein
MKEFVTPLYEQDEDFVREEFAQEFGIDPDDAEFEIEVTDWDDFGVQYYQVEVGQREYIAFEDEDDAEEYAVGQVMQDLEDDPTMFSQNWLQDFIYISNTDKRMIALDMADYINDMDDEDVLSQADVEDDYEAAIEDDDLRKADKILDDAREALYDDEVKRWEEGLEDDPIGFLVNDEGLYSIDDLLKQSFIQIDYEEAAKDAVKTDGVAHFLASYDGNENETDGGIVYYRRN